jgi:hypothetical protein
MRSILSLLILLSFNNSWLAAQELREPSPAGPHHPIATKNAEAQKFFDQGLTLVFAFNHEEAARAFRRASELDAQLLNNKCAACDLLDSAREVDLLPAIVAACASVATLLSLIPFSRSVEQSYPLLSLSDSPAQFSIPTIPEGPDNPSGLPNFMTEAVLSIPLNVSGVVPGSVVLINGVNLTVDSSDDAHWTRGWVGQYQQLWPGSQRQNLNYQVKRKKYEKVKAKLQNLHIQLALSEYQEADARTLVLPTTSLRDNDLGICRLSMRGYQVLECRKPFHPLAYMGRFDAPHSPCGSVRRFPNNSPTNLDVAYAWSGPTNEVFPDPGLNPIVEYQVSFNPVSRIPDPHSTSPIEYSAVSLCSGAEVRLTRPVFKRRFRIHLELPAVRLQDLVSRDTFGGVGVSIDLRTPM